MQVETVKGLLKCKKPNVLEIYDYLESVGSLREENAIKLQGMMIKAIKPYLDFSEMKEPVTFDEMISDPDNFFKPLVKLSDELYSAVIGVLSKKA